MVATSMHLAYVCHTNRLPFIRSDKVYILFRDRSPETFGYLYALTTSNVFLKYSDQLLTIEIVLPASVSERSHTVFVGPSFWVRAVVLCR